MLVPPGGYELLGSYPIAAQANFVPGGCLLHVCLNHSFSDGLGGAMAIGFWAGNCKDLQNSADRAMCPNPENLQKSTVGLSQLGNAATFKPLRLADILLDSTAPRGEELATVQGDSTLWQLLGLQKPPTDPIAACDSIPNKVTVAANFCCLHRIDPLPCILRARYSDLEDPGTISSRLRIPITVCQILDSPHD